jgi:hypothetical protein
VGLHEPRGQIGYLGCVLSGRPKHLSPHSASIFRRSPMCFGCNLDHDFVDNFFDFDFFDDFEDDLRFRGISNMGRSILCILYVKTLSSGMNFFGNFVES